MMLMSGLSSISITLVGHTHSNMTKISSLQWSFNVSNNTAVQSQKAVLAQFSSKQIMPFDFAGKYNPHIIFIYLFCTDII